MLDAEDRAVLAYYGIRAVGFVLAVMGGSATLAAALRLFDFIKGL